MINLNRNSQVSIGQNSFLWGEDIDLIDHLVIPV